MAKPKIRSHQWCACCFRDSLNTHHWRIRAYFTRERPYVEFNRRCGITLGWGHSELSLLWGYVNELRWKDIQNEAR